MPGELFIFDPVNGLFGAELVTGPKAAASRFGVALATETTFFDRITSALLTNEQDVFVSFALSADAAARAADDEDDPDDERISAASVEDLTVEQDRFSVRVVIQTVSANPVGLTFPIEANLDQLG